MYDHNEKSHGIPKVFNAKKSVFYTFFWCDLIVLGFLGLLR